MEEYVRKQLSPTTYERNETAFHKTLSQAIGHLKCWVICVSHPILYYHIPYILQSLPKLLMQRSFKCLLLYPVTANTFREFHHINLPESNVCIFVGIAIMLTLPLSSIKSFQTTLAISLSKSQFDQFGCNLLTWYPHDT